MSNILNFTGGTLIPHEPDTVLNAAIGKLETVLVVGVDKNGELYVASDNSSVAGNLLLCKRAEMFFMDSVS